MDLAKVENKESENENIVQNKNSTRYKKRFMKRQWVDYSSKKENGETEEKKLCDKPVERIKKKKMALLLGYCGVDYFGMQRNPGVRTIEEDLFKAMLDAKYINEDDYNNQQNTQFQRSSRTDKGVSAARQVVSLKLREVRLFFLKAPGGTGKTLINSLLAQIQKDKGFAVSVASSGIAATLLSRGRTAHLVLKLPLNLSYEEMPVFDDNELEKAVSEDECTMSHKIAIEVLYQPMKDIKSNQGIMGGMVVLITGDFRHTYCGYTRGTPSDKIQVSAIEANIDEINKRLPECIRIFGMKRVTNKFNSKVKCDARTYSYTLPTYVFESSVVTAEERKQYRITPETLEHVNKVLSNYKGTKCYHNFTEKKHYQDPSASRYMMGFSVEKVFVESDMEFAVLLVKGQSFMLHQIRKMVGLAVALVRGHADPSVLERAISKDKVMIPTAPGLGLVLDMVHYTRYDARYKSSHDSLEWAEEEETVQRFKHEHIYPNIVKGEIEQNAIAVWLDKLTMHSYEPSEDTTADKTKDDDEKAVSDDEDDDDEECLPVKDSNSEDELVATETKDKEPTQTNNKEACDDNTTEKQFTESKEASV